MRRFLGIKELQRTISSFYLTDALYHELLYLVPVSCSVTYDLNLSIHIVVPTYELIHSDCNLSPSLWSVSCCSFSVNYLRRLFSSCRDFLYSLELDLIIAPRTPLSSAFAHNFIKFSIFFVHMQQNVSFCMLFEVNRFTFIFP